MVWPFYSDMHLLCKYLLFFASGTVHTHILKFRDFSFSTVNNKVPHSRQAERTTYSIQITNCIFLCEICVGDYASGICASMRGSIVVQSALIKFCQILISEHSFLC